MKAIYKLVLSILFQILLSQNTFTQNHDYIWLSGNYNIADNSSTNFIFDFKQFPPSVLPYNSRLFTDVTNLSFSDSSGFLSFYSNGCSIRNKNDSIMEGGEAINIGSAFNLFCTPYPSGYRVPQGMFALPFANNQIVLFYIRSNLTPSDAWCANDALLYSRIDMNANQGLGKVVLNDVVLKNGCFQVASANKHANGRDWWVLLVDNKSEKVYRYLVSDNEVQGPWQQSINNPTAISSTFYLGWSEFSQNGEFFIINDVHEGTVIYDFDRCTGLLSNLRFLPADASSYGYGAAISPNSRYVYLVKGNFFRIDQYDLWSDDIEMSKNTVAEWDSFYYYQPGGGARPTFFSFFQHGPDGKLYIWAGDTPYMHTVNFPNRESSNCVITQRMIDLPYYTFGANIYYPNYRLGPIDGSSCDSLGIDNQPVSLFRYDIEDTLTPLEVTFTDLSYYEPNSWHWNFGDNHVSQDTNPVHEFISPGLYNVCLTVSNLNSSNTFCQQVSVGTVSVFGIAAITSQISVYPNPCTDYLVIQQPTIFSLASRIVLSNTLGQVVMDSKLPDSIEQIDVRHLPSGIYFWHYCVGNAIFKNGLIVKQ